MTSGASTTVRRSRTLPSASRVAIGRNRLLHQCLRADEDDVHIRVFAQRVDGAVHVDLGGEIAAHRVYDNFHGFFSFIFS